MGNLAYLADVVWPALLFASYERGVAAIVTGLIAEFLVLRYVFPMGWKKAILIDITMNFASSLVGAVAIPACRAGCGSFFPAILFTKC